MTDTALVDRLAAHKMLAAAPREELEWLAAHGTLRELATGDVLTPKGAKVEGLFIVLSGRITIMVEGPTGPKKVMEWQAGDVTGMLPYSRLQSPPADTFAEEPSTIFAVHRDHLRELILHCHEVTAVLVHGMVDRARAFTSSGLQDEKMASLGRLSAGLAHELNNPVAAIERGAALLGDRIDDVDRSTRELGTLHLSQSQREAMDALREACRVPLRAGVLSPMQRAEREQAIADWLDDRGLEPELADALSETAVTVDALEQAGAAIEGPALATVVRAAAATCAVRALASEIQEAATRISGLVIAIKGFTHMDQATLAGPVDLMRGLDNTVTVLKSKARKKSAAVSVDAPAGLPRVRGFAGELNQVWSNLIDNALDAIPEEGRVDVIVHHEGDKVVVRVVDNGPGISPQNLPRIYDPFFTTKPMGQGTGMGLDIVRRLVRHSGGEIDVDSKPGRTEFRVTLPVADASAGAAS
jgi:signal transduction histidine kinase